MITAQTPSAPISTPLRKGFSSGTHRLVSPEETLRRMTPLMPVLGITRIADVTGLDTIGIPVVMVTRPNARSLSVAQGKGLTLAAAKASGLMESIESYHGEHITLPLRFATYNELRFAHRMIDVPALPRHATGSFHPELRTLWIEGNDLFDGGPRLLPYAVAHTDFTLPLPPGAGIFITTSSGLSSGNHFLEAMSHSLAELIERDASTLWRTRGLAWERSTRVDLDSIDDPACREILAMYHAASIAVEVWDITSDIGVAAFRVAILDREPQFDRKISPMGGIGCHPSRAIALLRALTEAAQSRLTMISGARDDLLVNRLNPDKYVQSYERFHMRRDEPGPKRRFTDVPTREHDSFEADIAFMLEGLHRAGIQQAVAINLTKPEFGVPVVRVVIPGLEGLHDAPGFQLGKRAQAVRQEVPS